MGIRIQGSNDTILATAGSWNAEGIDLSAGLNVDPVLRLDNQGDVWKVDEYGDRSYMWDYY